MKIALPVKPQKEEYLLSPAFGKAKFFLIYDTETQEVKIVENEHLSGRDVVNILSKEKVNVVITNHLGGGAYRHIIDCGIKAIYTESKNAPYKEVINQFLEGKLREFQPTDFMLTPHIAKK
ncbi:NifB/NifX family molybdenum-iron cluster-binding protein [Sulfurihydrogenibium subterraneum]|uniref:NifB/NifX family molybdenum-iron cluster-binding protein n=1 Tax=Sulfurihydrogenibium subterraneum TaxID=171121 RepID=UPI0006887CD0|nr:NifB/NifX family molybdenum-iron cluster-binding protein [Sulfurihydrogenibium subterraneum]